ncbi:MAG: Asp-tRNA(Asn)/Glu-tRNA(Gln) amidotransferase GatCAB subunit B, partial [Candidatus Omnitrophica bacterium]|nr:Asp-tRNA(Asn)/Glu-tRNA(Gln) amidotransferase GatCAB subunit B [Candidatus Omnitrophota bacterium]
DPQAVCNWLKGEIMMHMNERNTDISGLNIRAADLAEIIGMTKNGTISGLAAKDVLRDCIDTGRKPADIVREKGVEQVSDESVLEGIITEVIAGNERSVNDFKEGKQNAVSFLVGQVMKLSGGRANPKLANEMLRKKLE